MLKNNLLKSLVLFCIGGFSYIGIELLWRGYSHWTMCVVGGICFVLIGLINEIFTFDMPLLLQMCISSIIVTIVEFISGYILNIKLGLLIWDYSNMVMNIKGQICLLYMVFWFFLSAIAIILDDYLRYWLFGEEKPHYTIIL